MLPIRHSGAAWLLVAAAPAVAAPRVSFIIPAGNLGNAAIAVGIQAGVSIGLSDPTLGALPVAGFAGTATVASALDRLLRDLPARAMKIDLQAYRIVRRLPLAARRIRATPVAVGGDGSRDADLIVSASKRDTRLDSYPGSAIVLDRSDFAAVARGTAAVSAAIPSLESTHLGRGRNKLFIRGVADSSFNGPTQATVGEYLGEVRLTYAAPDPDIDLVDVAAVEILEGPQGTLYGAGSLGGIVRLVPEPVRLDSTEAIAAVGATVTAHGRPSTDAAAMLNLPLLNGRLGVRAVGYRSTDGGYIDDVERGLRNINRGRSLGGRIVIRAEPGDGWRVEAGGILQNIGIADGQYAERGLPPLTRRSRLAQPFDNDYSLGELIVSKDWNQTRLVSATGIVDHDVMSHYDFTPSGGTPTAFTQDNRILLISNETRLGRSAADGSGWLLGTSFVSNDERLTRSLGPAGLPMRIIGVRNVVTEAALYGETTIALRRRLSLTVGGRMSYDRLVGEALDRSSDRGFEPRAVELRVLPSASLAWRATGDLIVFARYQQGYRPGGLSVVAGTGTDSVERFHADSIATSEIGARFGSPAHGVWSGAATLSYAHWFRVQADLVDLRGLPYSTNIGTGRVLGLELRGGWRPTPRLKLDAALFVNDSRLEAVGSDGAELPNIAHAGGRLAFDYRVSMPAGLTLALDGSARYVGRSRLGVGPMLDIPQGDYIDTVLGIRLGQRRMGLSLDATNLFDAASNQFSFGNPFSVAQRQQVTPLRPRSLRLGLDARF